MSRVAALISIAFAAVASAAGNLKDRSFYEAKFYDWLQRFEHLRPKSGDRFIQMLKNFADNDDIIEQTNAQKLSYQLGHNEFSGDFFPIPIFFPFPLPVITFLISLNFVLFKKKKNSPIFNFNKIIIFIIRSVS